jgi:hypothetical protein
MKQQKPDEVLDLGTWMGRKQAFASLAGCGPDGNICRVRA